MTVTCKAEYTLFHASGAAVDPSITCNLADEGAEIKPAVDESILDFSKGQAHAVGKRAVPVLVDEDGNLERQTRQVSSASPGGKFANVPTCKAGTIMCI